MVSMLSQEDKPGASPLCGTEGWAPNRGLGRIWATGCVKEKNWVCKILPRYAHNSLIYILSSFAAQKTLYFAQLLDIKTTFVAQIFKKNYKKNKK